MRDHILNKVAPNYYYHQQPRLSEYELNKLKGSLNQKPKIASGKLEGLRIPNLTFAQDDGLRGAALHERLGCLNNLKKAGVQRVINLAYNSPKYENACLENGLEYLSFPFNQADFWLNEACSDQKSYVDSETRGLKKDYTAEDFLELQQNKRVEHGIKSRKTIEQVITYIKTIQKGNYYIGCAHGRIATDQALILNRYFNPENKLFSSSEFGYENSGFIQDGLRHLYKNFTDDDKKRLGFTPEFEKELTKKLKI